MSEKKYTPIGIVMRSNDLEKNTGKPQEVEFKKTIHNIQEVGNTYGSLVIMEYKRKYYWQIQDYDYDPSNMYYWEEIPKSLYDELLKRKDN